MKKLKIYFVIAISVITIIFFCTHSRVRSSEESNTDDDRDYKIVNNFKEALRDAKILERTSDCNSYFSRLFSVIYNSQKQIDAIQLFKNNTIDNENLTKVAMSFVIHDHPDLFEILFHLTFKPYNSYCIYINPKSTKKFQNLIFRVLNSYQKIFPESKIIVPQLRTPIHWGGYSLLHADLQCLEELYLKSK